MASEKLTRATVLARALELADTEGLPAVTIRRLAQELGVTPMALYWHFKNKELLLIGLFDEVFAQVAVAADPAGPWDHRLRLMVEALLRTARRHPWISEISAEVDKRQAESFQRGTDLALRILAEAGFSPERAFQVATYLLNGVMGLVVADPCGPTGLPTEAAAEHRRLHRLELESLSPARYPALVAYARTLADEPDPETHYAFGLDLLLAGVRAMAPAQVG
ncbi:TetR family transcriptional regulator [Actinomadura craniellae]|uniref:TetR family transcriptional regulator n=1 Tax=Actinomadura craniellae TaxID=2231787 RepID=A0A365GZK1_9ACTN|nr:TetR/AcrR family transcriptional regulator C-terminal domain-containing protein [Actinomadura craniellae]RAY12198.1 TetR family transcriptional regulator [Actinomadura craniellae]